MAADYQRSMGKLQEAERRARYKAFADEIALQSGVGKQRPTSAAARPGTAARDRLTKEPAPVIEALDDLVEIAERLSARFPDLPLYFDLGELRGYHYHTGVVFAVFVPGVGQSIAQGGRYDDIGADFGRARPATGFSTEDRKSVV